MKIPELKEKLDELGIPRGWYSLDGTVVDGPILQKISNEQWRVWSIEANGDILTVKNTLLRKMKHARAFIMNFMRRSMASITKIM